MPPKGNEVTENTAIATQDAHHLPPAESIGGSDITAGAQRMSFAPTSMREAMDVASLMADCNFVPKHLRGKPGDCLAVVMQSSRWAMDPFAVGNKTYFVNDRMAYEAQLVNAVVNSSNVLDGRLKVEWFGEGNELECLVTGRIKGDSDLKTRRVKINTITTRNSPLWKQDPEQQLAYFAQRAWARLHTPEVLLGVYTPDEVEAIPSEAKTQKLSSKMLADQAGVTVEQDAEPTTDASQAEPTADTQSEAAAETSEKAQETLNDIDGPLDAEEQAESEDQDDGEPIYAAKRAEIIAAIDKCKTVVDLRALHEREALSIEAMPDDVAEGLKLQFNTMREALRKKVAS